MTTTPQTIISLRAENVKRLSAIEITPDGQPLVTVGGMNGAGKSSVLDAIQYACAGKAAMPEAPIRAGADRATILMRTQDYVIERRITPGGSTVTVRASDGSPLKSPQAVLDSLCADIAFDPLAFLRMKPKDQVAALAGLAGIDLAQHDAERQRIFAERTAANRAADDHAARIEI